MGWWKVQGTETTIGDEPLDTLGGAVSKVVSEYQKSFNRRPSKSGWAALLNLVLGSEEYPASDQGSIKVQIE
jgi:hypothetical protein